MALEANNETTEKAIRNLLKAFDSSVLITRDQLERGFFRVFDDLPDICMDVPLAYVILDRLVWVLTVKLTSNSVRCRFIDACRNDGFLTDNIIARFPSRGRKRFVSEGDHFVNRDKVNKSHEY